MDATATPAAWAALVNPAGQYAEGDPAWEMFQSCATRTSANVGLCATVVWAQSTDLQLQGPDHHQHAAGHGGPGHTPGARAAHRRRPHPARGHAPDQPPGHLLGQRRTTSARIARVSVRDSYIEGDTDFVFGRASAVFTHTPVPPGVHPQGLRRRDLRAQHRAAYPYGFLVTRSLITADDGYRAAPTGYLGRAWDQGAGTTGYLPGVTPNGQLVIRGQLARGGLQHRDAVGAGGHHVTAVRRARRRRARPQRRERQPALGVCQPWPERGTG